MSKTVYVLGAGFSIEAGGPTQDSLIKSIIELQTNDSESLLQKKKLEFRSFLTDVFLIPPEMHKQIPLEDIFTPIDRCLLDNISFRSLDREQLLKLRETINFLISSALDHKLRNTKERYVDKFAEFLVEKCKLRRVTKGFDPCSVISTNWDILLDNALKNYINTSYPTDGVVDYCCHISSYRGNDESVKPGLEKIGAGGFNVKLLKLHGSLNWLQCPCCCRIYVDFGRKIAMDYFHSPAPCRHCEKNFKISDNSINLVTNLVMPTFLKNLSNPQYKVIWQNAGIELSEASRIIFIGYSLPQSDFEMRQLLARMVRNDAVIEVVDFGEETSSPIIDLKKRYTIFFGGRQIQFHLKGTKRFIEESLSN